MRKLKKLPNSAIIVITTKETINDIGAQLLWNGHSSTKCKKKIQISYQIGNGKKEFVWLKNVSTFLNSYRLVKRRRYTIWLILYAYNHISINVNKSTVYLL